MDDRPAPLEDFAAYVARVSRPPEREDPAPRPEGITVRTFAGPAAYAQHLDHLRVAHLTDLHVGRVTPLRVQKAAVALANAARPDLVAITGDFVCHSQRYLDQLAEVAAGFEAPVVAVLGNHDHWSGADEVRRVLRRAGVEVLDNCHTTVTLRHQRLQILGLDDAYTGHADRARALAGLRPDLPTLGLSHIAEEADALWRHGVPLVLAGHTHAGQITVARLHEIAIGKIAGHKYIHGLYGTRDRGKEGKGAVYVGAGIGSAVIPLRLGERGQREITLFELGYEPGRITEHHGEQPPLPGRKPSPGLLARRREAVERKRARRDREA
jgi:hypothetical protein